MALGAWRCVITVRMVEWPEGSSSGFGSSVESTSHLSCNFRVVVQFFKPDFPCLHCIWPASLWYYCESQMG